MGLAICSHTVGILINVKNIVNLDSAIRIAVINTVFRNQPHFDHAFIFSLGAIWKLLVSSALFRTTGREVVNAFANTWSSNPGICH